MLSDLDKAYIAGFLDGDGCIMFQLVRRKDYVWGYQIRASIVFYQKTVHRNHLEWLKSCFETGYVRDRNDGMSEYTIVGLKAVKDVLVQLQTFLRLKKPHAQLAFKIFENMPKRFTNQSFIKIGKLVDGYQKLNYSKRRSNTSDVLKRFLEHRQSSIPVTTDS